MTSLLPFCFVCLKKPQQTNNYFYDTVVPNQSLPFFFFLMNRERLGKNIFCFVSALWMKWSLETFLSRIWAGSSRPYWHQPQIAGDASMNCGFCECGMLLVHIFVYLGDYEVMSVDWSVLVTDLGIKTSLAAGMNRTAASLGLWEWGRK